MAIIGIDLGTTNSLVAFMENGRPRVLPNELNEFLTPSAVAMAEDGQMLVGRAAKDRLVQAPGAGKSFFKRDMGTNAKYTFGKRIWTPTECSAMIIYEMKRVAKLHLKTQPIDRAVITVPAYFREEQRQATVEAAKIAGLGVARMINEPTAAALAYGYRHPEAETRLLVFDIGGGTFDVTLLDVFEGVFEVAASGGDSHLGGEDYTDALLDRLLKQCGIERAHQKVGRMRQQIEVAKRRLSSNRSTAVVLEGHEMVLRREDLEEAGRELTARLRPVVLRCMRDGDATPDSLNDILLVGGASRMHVIRDFVTREFKRDVKDLLDPDQAIALGAAVQASLCDEDDAVRDLVLTDVCSHTLGLEVAKRLGPGLQEVGYFEPLIDRNTTVPVSRSKVFTALHPTQDVIVIEVFQGEARMVKDNLLLGKLRVKGLRRGPGQREPGQVDVRFTYDMNGLLEVEATVLHSGERFRTVIEQRPGAMTPQQIEAAMQRLVPLKTHPRNLVFNRARLERANRLYEDLSGEDRNALGSLLDAFEVALASLDEKEWTHTGVLLDQMLAQYYREEGESFEGDGSAPLP